MYVDWKVRDKEVLFWIFDYDFLEARRWRKGRFEGKGEEEEKRIWTGSEERRRREVKPYGLGIWTRLVR